MESQHSLLVRRPKLLATVLLLLALQPPQAALAQRQPPRAIDCSGELIQQQMNSCAAQEYWERDGELNRQYQSFKGGLSSLQRELLTDSSLAWIAFRDAECSFRAARYGGGSLQPFVHASCMTELTNNRIAELPNTVKGFGLTYAEADRQLNDNYQALLRGMSPHRREQLIDAQLAWIDYRDRQCIFETDYEGTGAIANNPCLVRLTDIRSQQLVEP